MTQPLNHATGLLLVGVLIGFGINLNDLAEIAVTSFFFYAKTSGYLVGILFWFIFAMIAFCISYLLFRFSFLMINWATPENEKEELGKNNWVLATIHAVVYIMLCLVLSESVSLLANTLVDYPEYPN
ncbi:MAG: hypothetical protein EBS17_03775 [Flavobacteriia bacterium]|nr:hypothetical protein [Flavobacteriia bacterium]